MFIFSMVRCLFKGQCQYIVHVRSHMVECESVVIVNMCEACVNVRIPVHKMQVRLRRVIVVLSGHFSF